MVCFGNIKVTNVIIYISIIFILITTYDKINEKTIKRILLKDYKNNILFKVVSKNAKYTFYYSLNDGENFKYFTSLDAIKMLDRNYTGALLGVFSTSNGNKSSDYADYDWVLYKDYIR